MVLREQPRDGATSAAQRHMLCCAALRSTDNTNSSCCSARTAVRSWLGVPQRSHHVDGGAGAPGQGLVAHQLLRAAKVDGLEPAGWGALPRRQRVQRLLQRPRQQKVGGLQHTRCPVHTLVQRCQIARYSKLDDPPVTLSSMARSAWRSKGICISGAQQALSGLR